MIKVLEDIILDLKEVDVQGWEGFPKGDSPVKHLNASKVADYVKMNFYGSISLKVDVVKKGNIYQIVYGQEQFSWGSECKGGHYRTASHLISGHKLNCRLLSSHRTNPSCNFFSIRDIVLREDRAGNFKKIINFLEGANKTTFSRFIEMYDYSLRYVIQGSIVKDKLKNYLKSLSSERVKLFYEKHDF